MKITIQGIDYTFALSASKKLVIERKLNETSRCDFSLCFMPGGNLVAPSRNQTVVINGDDGTAYFTGYIVTGASREYSGDGMEGPSYRVDVVAMSEDVLLDQLVMPPSAGVTGETAASLLGNLITHSGSSIGSAKGAQDDLFVSNFAPRNGESWSASAAQIANMARAAYRVSNGTVSLASIPVMVHTLDEDGSTLNPLHLTFAPDIKRLPANDVTLCGEQEPVAYVTEYFRGDGITSSFYLSAKPYSASASSSTIIRELFDGPSIDTRVWNDEGDSSFFALGAGGLLMRGGPGTNSQSTLSWLDPLEMGGTLLIEIDGITLAAGSAGILGGFFSGGNDPSCCTAGLQVSAQQGSGNVNLQALIQGMPAGTAFSVQPSNQYTIRLRVHSPECHRVEAIYRGYCDSGPISAGGDWNVSQGKLQLEVQEFVNGVGGMPVTLYDGTITSLPGVCTFAAATGSKLVGSIRAIRMTNLGSGWVESSPPSGGVYTRRLGSAVEAGECEISSSGKLQFQTGFVPVTGETIAVFYRTVDRAVGRAVNAENQHTLTESGVPAISQWIGTVREPPARCSGDCRNAAMVTAQTSAGDSSMLRGTYKGTNFEFGSDVWPGDALQLNLPSANLNSQVVIREVKLSYGASVPDLVEYDISFANDWAEDLSIQRSDAAPADAWLPVPIAPTVLPNLSSLTVTSVSGNTVVINTGMSAAVGGGFEVRRRDFEFMAGTDPGLVTRSILQNITFSRETANDRFYVRAYDGSTPPNYSEFSTALFINLPLGS